MMIMCGYVIKEDVKKWPECSVMILCSSRDVRGDCTLDTAFDDFISLSKCYDSTLIE